MRELNWEADHLQRQSNREFRFWPTFRFPVDDGFAYKRAIAAGSMYYAYYTDIFHSYISWVDFPDAEEFRGRSYRYRTSYQSVIARAEKDLDELVSNLSEERNSHQKLMKNLVRLIRPDTWPFLASCLYEAFKENQDSSSLSKTVVTDLISEDDFEKFNHYFKYYVGSIAKSLRKVLESEDTLEMVQLTYELTKSEIKSINFYNFPSMAYFVLQMKTVLKKADFKELWTELNQTEYFIQQSIWKYETGRWPEMETFVKNFLLKTVGNEEFWDRLPQQFIPEMVKEKIPQMMYWLRTWLKENDFDDLADINMEDVADTFFEKLTSIMNMIADGDAVSIRQLFKKMQGFKWDKTVTSHIETIGDKLTRFVRYICILIGKIIHFPLSVVTSPPRCRNSPRTTKSSPTSSTTTSSSLSRPSCSMTGLKMKYIQPALRILSQSSTTLDTPYSVLFTEKVPATRSRFLSLAGFSREVLLCLGGFTLK